MSDAHGHDGHETLDEKVMMHKLKQAHPKRFAEEVNPVLNDIASRVTAKGTSTPADEKNIYQEIENGYAFLQQNTLGDKMSEAAIATGGYAKRLWANLVRLIVEKSPEEDRSNLNAAIIERRWDKAAVYWNDMTKRLLDPLSEWVNTYRNAAEDVRTKTTKALVGAANKVGLKVGEADVGANPYKVALEYLAKAPYEPAHGHGH